MQYHTTELYLNLTGLQQVQNVQVLVAVEGVDMVFQIVTKIILIGAVALSGMAANANALSISETTDIIAQLKGLFEVEDHRSDRCEYLVHHRSHYQKVLNQLTQQKRNLYEANRAVANLSLFVVFTGNTAAEQKPEQLKMLEEAEEKYGCKTYRIMNGLMPSHSNSFGQ